MKNGTAKNFIVTIVLPKIEAEIVRLWKEVIKRPEPITLPPDSIVWWKILSRFEKVSTSSSPEFEIASSEEVLACEIHIQPTLAEVVKNLGLVRATYDLVTGSIFISGLETIPGDFDRITGKSFTEGKMVYTDVLRQEVRDKDLQVNIPKIFTMLGKMGGLTKIERENIVKEVLEKNPVITTEDLALQAYILALKRQGNPLEKLDKLLDKASNGGG